MINGFEIVNIRRIQLLREIKLLGYLYSIAIFISLGFVIYKLFALYQNFYSSLYILTLIFSVLISFHLVRKDKVFLNKQFENPRRKIFYEYLLFTLPFFIPLLFSPFFYLVAVIPVFIYSISYIIFQFTKKTGVRFLNKIISPINFEWLSGIRKRRYYFSIVYLLAVVFSFMPVLPLVLIWILSILIYEFYCECEPLNMLRINSYSTKLFIRNKILRHVMLYTMFFIPLIIINSIINPEVFYINMIFFIVQLTILILAVLMKYKMYSPLDYLKGIYLYLIIIQTLTALPLFMGGIPFLLPMPLILCFKYYKEAKNNLNYYL
jgi:hypothetical protein